LFKYDLMKLKHKEGYWFVSLLLLAIIINVTFFGTTVFDKKDTININIHDTYFVIPQIYLVIVSTVSIWFWIYLIRMLYNKFTNLIVKHW